VQGCLDSRPYGIAGRVGRQGRRLHLESGNRDSSCECGRGGGEGFSRGGEECWRRGEGSGGGLVLLDE